jgi:hypothetical protein
MTFSTIKESIINFDPYKINFGTLPFGNKESAKELITELKNIIENLVEDDAKL